MKRIVLVIALCAAMPGLLFAQQRTGSLRGQVLDELGGAIGEGVTRSLLLLPVLSPRYVQSDWCNREINSFHAAPPPS